MAWPEGHAIGASLKQEALTKLHSGSGASDDPFSQILCSIRRQEEQLFLAEKLRPHFPSTPEPFVKKATRPES